MSSKARDLGEPGKLEAEELSELLESVARNGDRAAFATLFDYYAPRLKGFVMGMNLNADTADEVVQDVMLAVWRKAKSFNREKANASTWIYTIARNRRIDLARQAMRETLDPHEPALHGLPPDPPDTNVAMRQRDNSLRAAIAELPEEQAHIIRLAFTKGWSHGEISSNTGIPLGTVKSRMRLALARLRKTMGSRDEL